MIFKPFPFKVIIPNGEQLATGYQLAANHSQISQVEYYNHFSEWCAIIDDNLIPMTPSLLDEDLFYVQNISVSHLVEKLVDKYKQFTKQLVHLLYYFDAYGVKKHRAEPQLKTLTYEGSIYELNGTKILLSNESPRYFGANYNPYPVVDVISHHPFDSLGLMPEMDALEYTLTAMRHNIPALRQGFIVRVIPNHLRPKWKVIGQSYGFKVADLECRPMYQLREHIDSLRSRGRKFCISIENLLGGYSLKVNEGREREYIVLPSINTIQYGETYDAPYAYPLEHLGNLKLREGEIYFCYPPNFSEVAQLQPLLKLSMNHNADVRTLETNRILGKTIAEQLGYNVPVYTLVCQSSDEATCAKALSAMNGKVVLKYNQGRYLGTFNADCTSVLYEYAKTGDVVIEDYVSSLLGAYEINLSFIADAEGDVHFVLYLYESCKMQSNGSGGKIGLSTAIHFAPETLHSSLKPLVHKMSALSNILCENGLDDARGWFDISLMLGSDGNWYFTEWMFRNGISNFAIINMWNTQDYISMIENPTDYPAKFPSPFVISCEVVLTYYGGGYDEPIHIPNPVITKLPSGLCTFLSSEYGEVVVYFCPIEAGHIVGDYLVPLSQATVRLGVFNAHYTECELIDSDAISALEGVLEGYIISLNIPNAAYRLDVNTLIPKMRGL